ncbi:MAG: T9SS type A sorting domain-containing protein [Cryomorphaceae bacterium]|nr:T9SS type A sorting domain-containing protein [Cryomorphaceae bacterium]
MKENYRFLVALLVSIFLPILLGAQSFQATVRKLVDLPSQVKESSGIVLDGIDKVWTHNDSGYENELFLVDTNGLLLRTLVVINVTNMDWEDLAKDDNNNIWINDAGNNGNGRTDLRLYRIADPNIHSADSVTAEIIDFTFSDQTQFPPSPANRNFDIEAMVWFQDSLFLFTKNRSTPFNGYTKMYSLPATPGVHIAQLKDSLFVDSDIQRGRITAADMDPATQTLALLSRSMVLCFKNFSGTSFFHGDEYRYMFTGRVDQVEALAFIDSTTLYMTDEGDPGNNVPGGLYKVMLQENLSTENHAATPAHTIRRSQNAVLISTTDTHPYTCRLVNMAGQTVFSHDFIGGAEISTSTLPGGMYLIYLSNFNGMVMVEKIGI